MKLKEVKIRKFVPKRLEIAPHVIRPFQFFFRSEAASSIVLLLATFVAMLWANSSFSEGYHHFWEIPLGFKLNSFDLFMPLKEWINEGLMALFFFLVGLEIKREILVGELSSFRKAILPVFAAVGGMLVPAGIYLFFNNSPELIRGWAIPMATDIAFSLGVLYVLGRRVPFGLRIFLSAFAIADDLGSVLVIALFYTKEINITALLMALAVVGVLAVATYFWIRSTLFYVVMGVVLWYFILGSGLHATLAGIITAMFIPAKAVYNTDKFVEVIKKYLDRIKCPKGCGDSIMTEQTHLNAVQAIELACHNVETPLQRIEHTLQPWVSYGIVPLFALANAGITLESIDLGSAFKSSIALGIFLGLVVGKPVGITLFSMLAVKLGLAKLAKNISWRHIAGAGMLGGIGFTMSFFIAALSFESPLLLSYAKLGILSASLVSGLVGIAVLFKKG